MKKVLAIILSFMVALSIFNGCSKKQLSMKKDDVAGAETESIIDNKASEEDVDVERAAGVELGSNVRDERTPELTEDSYETVELYSTETVDKLSEEIQKWMEKAEETLKNVDPDGLAKRFFFYVYSDENSTSIEFKPIPHKEILFMQYLDNEWVTVEHSIADDGIITLADVTGKAVAVFTDPLVSPAANWVDLKPILTEESYMIAQIHTVEEVASLSAEIYNRMAEAKYLLKDACPEGYAVKYFFYLEILNGEESITVGFEPIDCNAIVIMQFVDGAWVELENTKDSTGVLTVPGVVSAPVAVFLR